MWLQRVVICHYSPPLLPTPYSQDLLDLNSESSSSSSKVRRTSGTAIQLHLFAFAQDSYRKVDVISKAEFNSQRGIEEYVDADSDLVFDLDQDEAPSAAKLDHTRSSEQERGCVTEREGRGKSPAKGSPSLYTHQRRRNEKRARFYPVLNKQHSPSKVSEWCVCVSTGYRAPFLVAVSSQAENKVQSESSGGESRWMGYVEKCPYIFHTPPLWCCFKVRTRPSTSIAV